MLPKLNKKKINMNNFITKGYDYLGTAPADKCKNVLSQMSVAVVIPIPKNKTNRRGNTIFFNNLNIIWFR